MNLGTRRFCRRRSRCSSTCWPSCRPDAPNEFFVLPQQDADALIAAELKRLKRPADYPMTGFGRKLALPFRDAWHVLPR